PPMETEPRSFVLRDDRAGFLGRPIPWRRASGFGTMTSVGLAHSVAALGRVFLMERLRGLIAVAVSILIPACGAALAQASKSQPGRVSQPTALIQGRPLTEWLAALGGGDPVERKWVLRVLGRVTRDQAGVAYPRLQDAIRGVMDQDKDTEV